MSFHGKCTQTKIIPSTEPTNVFPKQVTNKYIPNIENLYYTAKYTADQSLFDEYNDEYNDDDVAKYNPNTIDLKTINIILPLS